jgi:uncharacterized protein
MHHEDSSTPPLVFEGINTRNEYPNVRQSFGIMGIYVFVTLLVGIPGLMFKNIHSVFGISSSMTKSLVELICYILILFFTIRIVLKKGKEKNGRAISWWTKGKVSALQVFLIIILTALLAILIEPILYLVPSPAWLDKLMLKAFKDLMQPNIISFLSIVIAPAIMEEILMRGIVLNSLLKTQKPLKAIVISSLIFGLIHFNPMQLVVGFFAGLFLGWIYWRTRSLATCMVIHATNNAISFFFGIYFGVEATDLSVLGLWNYVLVVIVSAILFSLGVWWLSGRLRRYKDSTTPLSW